MTKNRGSYFYVFYYEWGWNTRSVLAFEILIMTTYKWMFLSAVEIQDVLKNRNVSSRLEFWLCLWTFWSGGHKTPPLQQATYSETDNPEKEGYLTLRISQHYMEGVMEKWISRFELQTLKGNSCFFIIIKAGPGICSGVTAFHTWTSKRQQNLIHFYQAMQ